mmetsp:Transcript_41393/g.82891  ORF Transcript_41393/g.82891 Transcript_41393/m.82891 type:complete len:84 (-) Transcript_41393:170-421(-)
MFATLTMLAAGWSTEYPRSEQNSLSSADAMYIPGSQSQQPITLSTTKNGQQLAQKHSKQAKAAKGGTRCHGVHAVACAVRGPK